jgi:hypothetical protein
MMIASRAASRTPRVIYISSRTPGRDQKVETPIVAEAKPQRVKRRAPKIPASEFARIRTLAEYGVTLEQLAENYGVSVREMVPSN